MSNPLSIFELSRAPLKRRKPFVHKPKEKKEKLIIVGDESRKIGKVPDFDRLDKLLEKDKENKVERSEAKTNEPSLPSLLLAGDIQSTPLDIAAKYKDTGLPIPTSKAKLKESALRHMHVIPKLLAGDEELSIYYTLAHDLKEKSLNATMSLQERWDIKWSQFIGGYFGLKRQSFVSMLIQDKHGALLAKSKNKTILFWLTDMFCTYVLANEILLRIVMEDMGLTKLQAEAKLRETADYGCHLADNVPLEDDLDFAEFEILGQESVSQCT